MKILFLNTWNANVRAPLSEFIQHHASDTDVFCFQEADTSLRVLCQELLGEHHQITAHKLVTESDNFHLAIYVRNTADIVSSGSIFSDEGNTGLGIYAELKIDSQSMYICNFHGMSRPTDKHDTPGRVRQSQGLVEFFKTKTGPKVIGGDFNVFPTNESIQLFQKNGYQDLIKDYKITNTRNRLVWDRYPENEKQHYADYVFVTPDIHVDTFNVPGVEVSDHLPLVLSASLQNSFVPTVQLMQPDNHLSAA